MKNSSVSVSQPPVGLYGPASIWFWMWKVASWRHPLSHPPLQGLTHSWRKSQAAFNLIEQGAKHIRTLCLRPEAAREGSMLPDSRILLVICRTRDRLQRLTSQGLWTSPGSLSVMASATGEEAHVMQRTDLTMLLGECTAQSWCPVNRRWWQNESFSVIKWSCRSEKDG